MDVDLESSGELASVEKMLANTDANKFTDFLQSGASHLTPKTALRSQGWHARTHAPGQP